MDVNCSGTLDKYELKLALEEYLSINEIERGFKRLDTDKNNIITFSEFEAAFRYVPFPNIEHLSNCLVTELNYGCDIAPIFASSELHPMSYIIAGGTAGVCSQTATAPLERLKIEAQVANNKRIRIKQTLLRIVAKEGISGLFAGNAGSCFRVFPQMGLITLSFSIVTKYTSDDNWEFPPKEPIYRALVGGAAVFFATPLTHPLDIAHARMTVKLGQSTTWSTIQACRKEPMGLFRGMGTSLGMLVPFLTIQQATYHFCKH